MILWARFFKKSSSDRRLLIQVFFLLPIIRWTLLLLPFGWVSGILRRVSRSQACLSPEKSFSKEQIFWAVGAVTRRLSFVDHCLTGALVTGLLLRRQGIPARLRIGVAGCGGKPLKAHAWIETGTSPMQPEIPESEQWTLLPELSQIFS